MANQSRSPAGPARVVLEGVPRVGYGQIEGRWELTPFPSSLRACMEFLGENYSYDYIMGASGVAFRLLWNPKRWDPGQVDVMQMAPDRFEPLRRAFEAVGYAHEILGSRDRGHDDYVSFGEYGGYDDFRSRIIESIRDKGRPVIGFGVIGPPECCIIAGYDEWGDVLIGWNYFQGMTEFNAGVEFEPSGYFRKRDWFKDTPGLIIVGEKREKPPLDEIYRKALKWALDVVRTPMMHERHNGLAAYRAWSEALQRDEDFPKDDMDVLAERMMVHVDAMTMVGDGRWNAALFLRQIAEHGPPMAGDLVAAAVCYEAEHDLMGQGWRLVDFETVGKLAEPGVRRQLVSLILQARDKDAEAADHIERALAR